MNEEQFDRIINTFVTDFNRMCSSERKDFLIREKKVQYEDGPRIKRYNVTYEVKKSGKTWKIQAVSSGFWIFKKRFPLLTIQWKKGEFHLKGLYIKDMKRFEDSLLGSKLSKYLEKCRSLPQNAFIRS